MKNFRFKLSLILFLLSIVCLHTVNAQDTSRFVKEVEDIQNRAFERESDKPLAVFTGSSSVRMWTGLEDSFPDYQVLNNGFGGSEFTDLIHFKEELIYSYNPDILFLYEGDNDIANGKSPAEILAAAAFLFADIRTRLPKTDIYFISPKPSISRWQLKDDYVAINQFFKEISEFDDKLTYIDVWTPMLDESGEVRKDLFIEDDLHMNATGYEIWNEIIGSYLCQQ